jgi:hypothetical protein
MPLETVAMAELQQQIAARRARAEALCEALRRTAASLLGGDALAACVPDTASYRLDRDPASGAACLVGEWRDGRGQCIGQMVFHGDGSCFGEYDVVRMHPHDARWFVEAVEAWAGAPDCADGDGVRADFRLLAAP